MLQGINFIQIQFATAKADKKPGRIILPWRLLGPPITEPEARYEDEESDEEVGELQRRRGHQEHSRPSHLGRKLNSIWDLNDSYHIMIGQHTEGGLRYVF